MSRAHRLPRARAGKALAARRLRLLPVRAARQPRRCGPSPSAGTHRSSCRSATARATGRWCSARPATPWPRSRRASGSPRSRSPSRSRVSVPAGYALARLKLPCARLIMIAVPAAAGLPVGRDLHQRRPRLLQPRPQRHGPRRRPRPRGARARLLGLDRGGGLRRGRPRPRTRGPQHRRLAAADLRRR